MDSLPPFLWGSFIPYNMPVYPGAFRVKSSCRKLKKSPKPPIFGLFLNYLQGTAPPKLDSHRIKRSG